MNNYDVFFRIFFLKISNIIVFAHHFSLFQSYIMISFNKVRMANEYSLTLFNIMNCILIMIMVILIVNHKFHNEKSHLSFNFCLIIVS